MSVYLKDFGMIHLATVQLPLVETFTSPYEVWEKRQPTLDEMVASGSPKAIKVMLRESISDPRAAADYILRAQADNGLDHHIQEALKDSQSYKAWQQAMPSRTPPALSKYQKNYKTCDLTEVAKAVDEFGELLSSGQHLFHGGTWSGGQSFITTRPLSTSLCPQVAIRNAEYRAKAYDAGRLDLFVLKAADPKAKAFVFKRKGTTLGHESEVLLAAGAQLTFKSETCIRTDYPAAKVDHPLKFIPAYVLDIEFS